MPDVHIAQPGLTVVVPVYCSFQTLDELVHRITCALSPFEPIEILLIDDGSKDSSWATIISIASRIDQVRGIRLSRNFGQNNAVLAGINHARFDTIVTLDDDLQNPPEEIPKLLNQLTPNVDVVYGVSEVRSHSIFRRATSVSAKKIMEMGLGIEGAVTISSFRAFRTNLRKSFPSNVGPDASVDALLSWSTSSYGVAHVEHHPRAIGTSKYKISTLINYFTSSIIGYSSRPLRIASVIGTCTLFFGIALFLWSIIPTLFFGNSVPGFPLLASSIAIFSGSNAIILGIIGEYIGRIHFRTMNKPGYVVSEITSDLD